MLPPPAFLRAAQRALMASESFRLPAAVRPPFFAGALAAGAELTVPFRLAQRALAAAANLARVAADIGRRPPPERRRDLRPPLELVEPPKRLVRRS